MQVRSQDHIKRRLNDDQNFTTTVLRKMENTTYRVLINQLMRVSSRLTG